MQSAELNQPINWNLNAKRFYSEHVFAYGETSFRGRKVTDKPQFEDEIMVKNRRERPMCRSA